MGVKYVKITTKHHEGFAVAQQYTEYTVANTPYKKDILGELVKAYNAVGIDVHFYFSVLDWSHPDWRSSIKTQEDSIAFQKIPDIYRQSVERTGNPLPYCQGFLV